MMWRLLVSETDPSHGELLNGIFVLLLCVTVLVRDSFAAFMRGFAIRQGVEPENSEYNRMRTIVAAPVSALLYAYAFYIPEGRNPGFTSVFPTWGMSACGFCFSWRFSFSSSTSDPSQAIAASTVRLAWTNSVLATRRCDAGSWPFSPMR